MKHFWLITKKALPGPNWLFRGLTAGFKCGCGCERQKPIVLAIRRDKLLHLEEASKIPICLVPVLQKAEVFKKIQPLEELTGNL